MSKVPNKTKGNVQGAIAKGQGDATLKNLFPSKFKLSLQIVFTDLIL
jgi:hypothetical protein